MCIYTHVCLLFLCKHSRNVKMIRVYMFLILVLHLRKCLCDVHMFMYSLEIANMHNTNRIESNAVQATAVSQIGLIDSSGFQITYLDTPLKYDAGALLFGSGVFRFMVIPPKMDTFDVYVMCDSSCTAKVCFPVTVDLCT